MREEKMEDRELKREKEWGGERMDLRKKGERRESRVKGD